MSKQSSENVSIKIKEIEATDDDFDEKVIKASFKIPVVVDFWAPWCGPCLIISPMLEDLVKEFKGKFVLVKVNIDVNKIVALRYDVMAIPNIKMFKDGKVVDEFVGVTSYPEIRKWFEKNLR